MIELLQLNLRKDHIPKVRICQSVVSIHLWNSELPP